MNQYKEHIMTLHTRTAHTQKVFIDLNDAMEIYNWNQARKNHNVVLSDIPLWPHQMWVCIYLLETASFNYL